MVQNRKINPWTWQDAMGFSQAVETSGHQRVLRCAGQTSVNANGEPQHAGDMAAQVTLAMDNLEEVLKKADMTLANVVRLNFYTTDVDLFFQNMGPIGERAVAAGIQPAGTLLGVSRLAFPGLMIEIEADAVA
jgi:enamine deaminase RidA (YjgF/YER057c/UK114 family)